MQQETLQKIYSGHLEIRKLHKTLLHWCGVMQPILQLVHNCKTQERRSQGGKGGRAPYVFSLALLRLNIVSQ